MNAPRLDVAIVGGGIGGLAAAIALQRRGVEARVFEAAPELRAVGAGIVVPPNALRVLAELGLAEEVRAAGVSLRHMEIRDLRAGLLQAVDGAEVEARYGHPTVAIRRAELQRILADALAPDTLHLGRRLDGFTDDGPAVRARFTDGSEVEAALLVGADGLRSTVREALCPRARPRYSGQSCVRGLAVLPEGEVPSLTREIWDGPERFGFAPVDARTVYWFAPWVAPSDGEDAGEGTREWLRERYDRFPWPVARLLESTPADTLLRTDLYDLPPLTRWHAGRVTLLGDAAHAATPNLGQGGAQALEDALSLALNVEAHGAQPAALAAFQRARQRRTRQIAITSWRVGKAAHWRNPLLRGLRNLALRAMPGALLRRQTDHLFTPGL